MKVQRGSWRGVWETVLPWLSPLWVRGLVVGCNLLLASRARKTHWTQNEGDPAQAGSCWVALHLSVTRCDRVAATASLLPSKSYTNLFWSILTQGRDSRNHSSQLNQVSPEQSSISGNGEQSLSEEHGLRKTEERKQIEFMRSFMEEA